jgi:hypothetical protein
MMRYWQTIVAEKIKKPTNSGPVGLGGFLELKEELVGEPQGGCWGVVEEPQKRKEDAEMRAEMERVSQLRERMM